MHASTASTSTSTSTATATATATATTVAVKDQRIDSILFYLRNAHHLIISGVAGALICMFVGGGFTAIGILISQLYKSNADNLENNLKTFMPSMLKFGGAIGFFAGVSVKCSDLDDQLNHQSRRNEYV